MDILKKWKNLDGESRLLIGMFIMFVIGWSIIVISFVI